MKKIKKRDIDIKTNQKLPLYFTALAFLTFAAIIIALSFLIFIGNKILGWDYMIDLHQSQFWVLVFMAIVLIGVIASILIGRPTLKGIKEISNSTKKISEGDFSVRISENKTKFLGRLSNDFNQMAKELEGVKILRNDFINNFSHEFKTPISSIKNYAEELRNNNLTKEEKDKYLDIIIKEATRLSNLSNSILYLSKVEKQSILTDKSNYDVGEQIRQAILLEMQKIEEKNLELDLDILDYKLCLNEDSIEQVWINILDNAIKFSDKDKSLYITSCLEDNWYVVKFKDEGIGIPDDDLPFVFEKFYKADKSHSEEGNGLGLSLVKRIIELHKGSIEIKSKIGLGTVVIVKLPIDN